MRHSTFPIDGLPTERQARGNKYNMQFLPICTGSRYTHRQRIVAPGSPEYPPKISMVQHVVAHLVLVQSRASGRLHSHFIQYPRPTHTPMLPTARIKSRVRQENQA